MLPTLRDKPSIKGVSHAKRAFSFPAEPTKEPKRVPLSTPIVSQNNPSKQTLTSTISNSLNGINQYRQSRGLSSLEEHSLVCSFASIRAQEISEEFSHNGFVTRRDTNSLPYPSYQEVVENIALSPNANEVSMWVASVNHESILRADVVYGCVSRNGNYAVFEGWKP